MSDTINLKSNKQSQNEYFIKYRRENYRDYQIKYCKNKEKERRIIEYLDTLGNKTEYIKKLIEQDLESKGII